MIGDNILIKRAGDVIPQIISVDKKARNKKCQKFIWPKFCPICQSPIIQIDKEVIKRCSGVWRCSAQAIARFVHFVSKKAFNIIGLSKESLQILYERKLVKEFADIFLLLKKNDQLQLSIHKWEGWGKKSTDNLFSAIEQSRSIDFYKFIYSLGIRHVGIVTAGILAQYWQNVNKIFENANIANYKKIEQIGPVIAASLLAFFRKEQNINMVKNLVAQINIVYTQNKEENSVLNGKKIVFTGSLKNFSRDKAEKKVKVLGAVVTSFITKETNLLISGENPGTKLAKARKVGIKVLNENEFFKLIALEQ